jgi:hypothetical protein
VEVMIPEPPGLNGTLTNWFGGNAFFICLFSPHYSTSLIHLTAAASPAIIFLLLSDIPYTAKEDSWASSQ